MVKLKKPASKAKWTRVTKHFVCSFAAKDCRNCEGKGYVGEGDRPSDFTVCSCATLEFRRQMIETGHVRHRIQAIGKQTYKWMEWRPLTLVK